MPWYRSAPGIIGISLVVAAGVVIGVVLGTSGGDGDGTATGDTSAATLAGSTTTIPATTTTTAAAATTTTATTTTASTTTTTTPPTTTAPSSGFADAFMEACNPEAGSDFCGCALTEFQAMYSEDELWAIFDGTDPVPEDFSHASVACFTLLPLDGTLPVFALPNTCELDAWSVQVRYPSGWEVDEMDGECVATRPADLAPEQAPIYFGVDPTVTMADIADALGDPAFTYEYPDRTVLGYLEDAPSGGLWVDYYMALWPDVPDGPVVYLFALGNDVADAVVFADMMLRGMEIAPYSP
jgi:preprotein translocase subunit SecG